MDRPKRLSDPATIWLMRALIPSPGRSFEGSGSWVISTRWTSLCRWLTDWLTERVYGTRSECLPWAPRWIISHRALGDRDRVTRVYRKGQQSGVERWQGPFVHQLLSNDVCSDGSLCVVLWRSKSSRAKGLSFAQRWRDGPLSIKGLFTNQKGIIILMVIKKESVILRKTYETCVTLRVLASSEWKVGDQS